MIETLRKLFDQSDKEVKSITPVVERVNALEEEVQALSDEQIAAKTPEFKKRLAAGQSLEDLLPEAFALVREVSKRKLHMRHFDVQIIGGAVLHQGRIAEMKTGEGKTLVAVAPLYLNALTGKGSHLVTVNDYLARRDAVWMGPIYHTLGVSVGVIQGQSADSDELGGSYVYDPGYQHEDPRYLHLRPCSRREAYLQDVTYGTNHEFGFDYLRDNMAFRVEQLSMRELNFAIVDEVDSILIDEARTPHIISGPSTIDTSVYTKVDKIVRQLQGGGPDQSDEPGIHYVADRKSHSASLTEEGMDRVEELLEIGSIAEDPRLMHHLNAAVKAYGLFQKDVDYVVRNNEVVIVDENTGRMMFGRRYSDGLHQALEAKENVPVQRESQTVATITFQNLFRMYNKLSGMTGTAKTEEDEFRKIYGLDVVSIPTHRPMVRTDHEDVVYKSLDVKFRGIARELLRLWTKQQPVLVGTRSIEMSEKVSSRMTAEALQKLVLTDRLFEKMNDEKSVAKAVGDAGKALFDTNLDDLTLKQIANVLAAANLSGDALNAEHADWFFEKHKLSAENRTYFDEALRHGVPHNVLNAKYHEKEAAIISEAGRKGAITIATNMAGRGVDILLGGRVADETVALARRQEQEDGGVASEFADTFMSFRRGGKERAAPPLPLDDTERRELAEDVRKLGGLFILGTERHESRRIDNQLRGRAGRQGDPGESRFFVSLEDQLWKIFNPKMLENPILKAWPTMEEVRAKFITGMILKTQERIENHFFEARKHVLEYDDVLNSQREHVYGMRREILLGRDCRADIQKGIKVVVESAVEEGWQYDDEGHRKFDAARVYEKLSSMFPLMDYAKLADVEHKDPNGDLQDFAMEVAMKAYDAKIAEVGEDIMPQIERHVMLQSVNDNWMAHLQMIDYIREGISLRAYAQTDPLIAYKRETHDLFEHTVRAIQDQAVRMIYMAQVRREPAPQAQQPQMQRVDAPAVAAAAGPTGANGSAEFDASRVEWSKIGRNDPCPCGSGKKFKSCHYAEMRAKGVI
jgi:preprotein translocase subunit SecA